jgi:hypothetical protein
MYMIFEEWFPRKFDEEQPAAAPVQTSPLPALE